MSRVSTIAIVVLASLALAEGVLLLKPASAGRNVACTDVVPRADAGEDARAFAGASDASMDAVLARLTAIDARLAALERVGGGTPAATASPARAEAPDPAGFADADRRLSTLLPGRVLGHDDVMRFQATIAALPADQKLALSAAFARAVNEDRIRLRF